MSNREEILSIQNLSVCYGDAQVLSNVNLSVAQGEIVGIVGESGSGKSTLLRAVARLLPGSARVSAGTISYKGINLARLKEKEMRALRGSEMGFLFQNAEGSLDPLFTIKKQFGEVLKSHVGKSKTHDRARSDFAAIQKSALDRVGLTDTDRVLGSLPSELSGGMCQRVAIAFALALMPDILLADEPTSALDVTAQEKVMDILRSLNREDHLSILMVSHDIELVSSLASKLIVMCDGHIVEAGPSGQIMTNPQQPYTRELIAAIPHITGEVEVEELGRRESEGCHAS